MQKPHGPPDVFPGGKNKELPGLNRMLIEDFVDIFSVWEEAQPYLSLMSVGDVVYVPTPVSLEP